jgi:dolichol-phosphate mannosyltransferase
VCNLSNIQSDKILILVPTYNEKDNVEWLYDGIRSLNLPVDVLFVDDNSPDGTGRLLDEMAKSHPEVTVLHQPGKAGIGKAHKVGIQKAYQSGYQTLITMDADLTHSPHDIPKLLEHSSAFSVVLGSRHLMENSLEGWNPVRKILTKVGKFLTTYMLGIKQDATGAFRVYRLDVIPPELFGAVQSDSYSFFFESLHLLHANKFKIHEVPIALPPRTYGSSKMNIKDILISIKTLLVIFTNGKFRKKNFNPRKTESLGKL